MLKKKSFLILYLGLKMLCLQAQTKETSRFKPRYALSSNFGFVTPLSGFSENNKMSGTYGTVLENDYTPHLFVRFVWDNFQFGHSKKVQIGSRIIDVNGSNNGNAFYLSNGYYTDINKWKFYSFLGLGYATINDPVVVEETIDKEKLVYLTNQNSGSLNLNWGIGTGFKMSPNEKITFEMNLIHMPNIKDKVTFASIQLGYRVFFTLSK